MKLQSAIAYGQRSFVGNDGTSVIGCFIVHYNFRQTEGKKMGKTNMKMLLHLDRRREDYKLEF